VFKPILTSLLVVLCGSWSWSTWSASIVTQNQSAIFNVPEPNLGSLTANYVDLSFNCQNQSSVLYNLTVDVWQDPDATGLITDTYTLGPGDCSNNALLRPLHSTNPTLIDGFSVRFSTLDTRGYSISGVVGEWLCRVPPPDGDYQTCGTSTGRLAGTIPEPATLALLGFGVLAIWLTRRNRSAPG
jgi:hypothetical protein